MAQIGAVDRVEDPHSEDLETRALRFAERAATVAIRTKEDYQAGIEFLQRVKRMRKSWDDLQRPAIRKAKEAHDEALKVFRKIDDRLAEAYDTVKDRCEAWVDTRRIEQRQQLAERREAMRVVETAAVAAHTEQLDQAFDQAVQDGDLSKAARIVDQVSTPLPRVPLPAPPPPPVTPMVPKVEGASVPDNWTYDVLDESLVPREYLMLDKKKIAGVVRHLKGDCKIPGIHARPDTSLRIRA